MADRTKLDSSFISLVLSVNGRVRPVDLHGLPEAERAGALQSFYQANAASTPMHFEGDVLVRGVASMTAAPQAPAVAPAEQPLSDYATAAPAAPLSDYSAAAPAAPPVSPAPAASAPFLDGPAPAMPAPFSAPDVASVEPFAAAPAPQAPVPPTNDFFAAPPPVPAERVPDNPPPAEFDLPAEKISVLFWLLPVLFTWVGGIIAYFLVRKLNPKTAKAMLITGIVLAVVFALAGVAVVALGLFAIPGL